MRVGENPRRRRRRRRHGARDGTPSFDRGGGGEEDDDADETSCALAEGIAERRRRTSSFETRIGLGKGVERAKNERFQGAVVSDRSHRRRAREATVRGRREIED